MVDFENDIKNCIRALETGGTILYPTDTVWGLGCNALDAAAVDKVLRIKNRPPEKSLIVLLADARDILQYVAAPPPDIIALVEGFDVPTTIVYEGALDFPANVVASDGSIGIRVSTDPFCKALIKRFRQPIISTSANLSGEPTPQRFRDISPAVTTAVDYTVHYRREDDTPRMPSRIARIDDDGRLQYIR